MVADDEPALCQWFVAALGALGYRVVDAADGKIALALLQQPGRLPCVAFIDVMMPQMRGDELRRRMLADARLAAIPASMMSADPRFQAQVAALQADFLPKPFDFDDVLAPVRQHCGADA